MNDPRAATNLEPTVANKHEALIAELADLIWPVIRERIASALDARINFAVENLIDDKIDDKINDKITAAIEYGKLVTEFDLDQRLNDYTETTDLEGVVTDHVRDWIDESLSDSVRDVLKHQITLTIDVD